MKKKFLSFTVIVLSLCIFSTTSFAQTDPGGTGDGSGTGGTGTGGGTLTPPQPVGYHFTRNNGDGTCGGEAQIRLFYTTVPTVMPSLTQIYYNGAPLYTNFLPVTGNASTFAQYGYLYFCLGQANIPPAIKLTLTYDASPSQTGISIAGTE